MELVSESESLEPKQNIYRFIVRFEARETLVQAASRLIATEHT
jgi:hypothetical protein